MAPTAGTVEETSTEGSTEEDSGQGQQGQQQDPPAGEAGDGGQQQASTQDGKLPDDHPIVKALAKANAKSAAQATELAEARSQAAKATKLEEELNARPSVEALATLQTRYDRLEGFLQAVGGPLARALDSRSFTQSLFESDQDIEDIVKAWQKANPTATAAALGAAAAAPSDKKPDMNSLIRAALK